MRTNKEKNFGGRILDSARESLAITALKLEARRHYKAYQNETDEMSCGNTLAEHISGTVSKHRLAFNATMDKLAKIDPSCPKARL